MNSSKTIHSRSNKEIGDIIEENWKITAKKVISEPQPGDRYLGIAPRLGIYEYEVTPAITQLAAKAAKSTRGAKSKPAEPSVGGTRREASTGPITLRRIS